MNYRQKLSKLQDLCSSNKNAERICSELIYLDGVSRNHGDAYNDRIEEAADYVLAELDCEGVITASAVAHTEEMLADLSPIAKNYTEYFIAHAHIDMNWMWGYQETAAITVDTFRTVLALMQEFPELTFAQSQASTYEIIEKLCPEMLPEIKERIREGRWEVTAAEWVEPDKNMPDGESLVRQILQARKYLSKLLEIDPATLDLDFVPDTFGHNANIPEILANAGVKYMYHCRGNEAGENLYRYVAPSGKKIAVYHEYAWYNGDVGTNDFEIVPGFCATEKVDTYLRVYGVGDHGGGPSRRDIERILEYRSWPLTPTIKFGTFHDFFKAVERCGQPTNERSKELNFIFTGCYTTQSRIKMSNRISEARINEAEALASAASLLADAPREQERFDGSWRNILFNHFHDIIPGSGIIETREYAMGRFQETLANVNTYAGMSMRRVAERIDTSDIPFVEESETTSEGAGVGYYQEQHNCYRFPSAERGRGAVRAIHLFNTTAYDRNEYTEMTIWDYPPINAVMTDADGNRVPFTVIEEGNGYWNHHFVKLLAKVSVPAFGYATVILTPEMEDGHVSPMPHHWEHTDNYINDLPIVLENEHIKAVFDKKTAHLVSLEDKKTGEKLIDKPSCYFRYADENPLHGMTSWRVGPFMKVVDLNATYNVRYSDHICNEHYSAFTYHLIFGHSQIECRVMLKADSSVLEFKTKIDWLEDPVHGQKIPQIAFAVPVSYKTNGKCHCDIPFGTIERDARAHDVPCLSFITADGDSESTVALMTDTKYGYRLWEDEASVTLLRSSYDPDLYPERGIHYIRIGVAVGDVKDVKKKASSFNHPLAFIPATGHDGDLALDGRFLSVEGDAVVSCVKNSEDGKGNTVRLYDETGAENKATIRFCKSIAKAYLTDSNENILSELGVKDGAVTVSIPAYSTVTVIAHF